MDLLGCQLGFWGGVPHQQAVAPEYRLFQGISFYRWPGGDVAPDACAAQPFGSPAGRDAEYTTLQAQEEAAMGRF